MGIVVDEVAAGRLTDRAGFALNHCGQPMRYRSSVAQSRGQVGQESVTTSARYTCDGCAATLEMHLTEPAVVSL